VEVAVTIAALAAGELHPMDGQLETSGMIDLVEVEYRLVKVKQQKYVCRCGGCVETAPGPERAAAGGRYSLGFAVEVALDKYVDHIPLARQERILDRHGLTVSSQTLWDQLFALAKRLRRTSDALLAHVMAQPVIGLDQTGWPRLEGRGTKPWQMWCLTAPGARPGSSRHRRRARTEANRG
jgi:transposase